MDIRKNYRINSLFEFYQPLLTTKQNNYMKLYYVDDYSLGEIADTFSVSRQAIYDNIRRVENILEKYEIKLHLYAQFVERSKLVDGIQKHVNTHYIHDNILRKLVAKLELAEE